MIRLWNGKNFVSMEFDIRSNPAVLSASSRRFAARRNSVRSPFVKLVELTASDWQIFIGGGLLAIGCKDF